MVPTILNMYVDVVAVVCVALWS